MEIKPDPNCEECLGEGIVDDKFCICVLIQAQDYDGYIEIIMDNKDNDNKCGHIMDQNLK